MAEKKIEIFRTIRNVYQNLGIHPPQSNQNSRFNQRNLLILLVQSLTFGSVSAFLLFRVHSIEEFGTTFSECIMILANTIFNLISIVEMENILKLIGQFEDFIEMSKLTQQTQSLNFVLLQHLFAFLGSQSSSTSKAMYSNLNDKIELISKWSYIFMIKIIVVGFSVGTLASCYANYYIFDLKEDSFILPVFLMWVMAMSQSKAPSKIPYFSCRSPLDCETPLGYLITFLSVVGTYYFVLLNFYQMLGFFGGSCGLIINFVRDISNESEFLNIGGRSNENDKNVRLKQLIQQHSDLKRLSEFNWSLIN